MPLSRPWIPLSRFLKPLRIAITLHCSVLILSPISPHHPFSYSSYLYRQRILTASLLNLSFRLENSFMSTLQINNNLLIFFLQNLDQSPHGCGIFIVEVQDGVLCVIEVVTWLPGVLLVSVILPLDEVLNSSSSFSC